MPHQHLKIEHDGPAAVITLNRPEQRNALSLELMLELTAALAQLEKNSAVHAVILAAAGGVYCSGHDLRQMVGRGVEEYWRIFEACNELMRTVQSIPQPVIAEVQGIATAAGCQLVAACDLAIASEKAGFATPGVRIGLFCSTPMVALSRAIGRKRALQMLLTGEVVDAHRAAEWGLVNSVVPVSELRSATLQLATRIAEASGFTVGIGKRAFYTQIDLEQPKAYEFAKEVMTANAMAADAQEGISAFLEKRTACWSGR